MFLIRSLEASAIALELGPQTKLRWRRWPASFRRKHAVDCEKRPLVSGGLIIGAAVADLRADLRTSCQERLETTQCLARCAANFQVIWSASEKHSAHLSSVRSTDYVLLPIAS